MDIKPKIYMTVSAFIEIFNYCSFSKKVVDITFAICIIRIEL